jgi:hypothetical protein
VHSGANFAGAAGPMQFGIGGLAGNTWGGTPVHPATQHPGGYGTDGDHDGTVNVYDPGDAIPSSAAAYLSAHGFPASMQAAIFACNHSSAAYVTDVLAWAARYSAGGARVTAAQAGPACQQADLRPFPAGAAASSAPPAPQPRSGSGRAISACAPPGRDDGIPRTSRPSRQAERTTTRWAPWGSSPTRNARRMRSPRKCAYLPMPRSRRPASLRTSACGWPSTMAWRSLSRRQR